jgi:hypothetical protein
MLSTPHIGRKRKCRIDQVKIYFVDAKQCQGILELEVFNIKKRLFIANLLVSGL